MKCNTVTCKYALRVVFLVFIIVVTSYFFWMNSRERDTEHFEDGPAMSPDQMIKKIYADLYDRLPTTRELAFYLEYVKQNANITEGQLADVIDASASSLGGDENADGKAEVPSDMIKTSMKEPEQVVIEAYGDILFRMPSPAELSKYTKMIRDDKTFTRERLVALLMATDEYMRMEKTQTNMVYSNLGGAVTDRQITMTIEKINEEVTGSSYVDPDTMRFYKRKFLEFDLDEVKFKVFLERYVMWTKDEDKIVAEIKNGGADTASVKTTAATVATTTTSKSAVATGSSNTTTSASSTVTATVSSSNAFTQGPQVAPEEDGPGTYYNNSTIYNIYTVGSADYMGMPNKALLDKLGSCAANSGTATGTSAVVKDITCQKGVLTSKGGIKSSDYADYMNTRNREELRSTCARNTKFAGDEYDAMFGLPTFSKEDMVLDPSLRWSVPQRRPPVCAPNAPCDVKAQTDQTALIGTLLDDAANTGWGSLLPPLPPS